MYISDKFLETFKLQCTKVSYRINEQKGTVTAIAEFYMPYDLRGNGEKYFQTVGIAYVNKDDTFVVEKGKKLARARAEKEAFIQFRKLVKQFDEKLGLLGYTATNTLCKMNQYIRNQNNYIKSF